jgi:hypothetical protein
MASTKPKTVLLSLRGLHHHPDSEDLNRGPTSDCDVVKPITTEVSYLALMTSLIPALPCILRLRTWSKTNVFLA